MYHSFSFKSMREDFLRYADLRCMVNHWFPTDLPYIRPTIVKTRGQWATSLTWTTIAKSDQNCFMLSLTKSKRIDILELLIFFKKTFQTSPHINIPFDCLYFKRRFLKIFLNSFLCNNSVPALSLPTIVALPYHRISWF